MQLPALTWPTGAPVLTVILDATRSEGAHNDVILDRWADLRRSCDLQGVDEVPSTDAEAVTDALERPTWAAGPHGRVLVAASGRILLDRVLPEPPAVGRAVVADRPHAFALARVADAAVQYLLIESDRAGARLSLREASAAAADHMIEVQEVDGGHEDLTKVRPGGMLARDRVDNRAEDSWERNAEAVAAEVDRIVADRRPDLVLLTGDVRSCPLVTAALDAHAREVLVEVPGGSRSEGVNARAFAAAVDDAVADFRARRREVVVARFRQEVGRDGEAVLGIADALDVLRRGQVAELVLDAGTVGPPSRLSERTLWIGADALTLGTTPDELADLGVSDASEVRADLAIGRAVLDQAAGITITDLQDVPDGLGAVLRWSDAATPAETAFSQSGDTARARGAV
ncbi:hypothetical protein [Ruania alba]|uniref:Peptide chain release factor 1 (ERF1) n=1 Tax=Ruania alba TaxID=648782 RepID=A0A1H5DPT4_9MICO|nr:hypothetical protein [Ruania alba]SED80871.1 hypothetical protein SAMN04488554_0753 [Ruania alba]